MQITQINLGDNSVPSDVMVKMSLDQAALIARLFGSFCFNSYDPTGDAARWQEAGSDIYDELTGNLFNRFWDDGVNEVLRDAPIVIKKN